MKSTNLYTIDDYLAECDRAKRNRDNAPTCKAKRQWHRYLCRLIKEIQTFDKFKGTSYATNVII